MRLATICTLIMLITSCTEHSSGYYTPSNSGWRGNSVNDLIKTLGTPYSIMRSNDGNTVYVYKRQKTLNTSTTYSPSIGVSRAASGVPIVTNMPNVSTPETRSLTTLCIATFTVNRQGKVIDSYQSDNNCIKSSPAPAKQGG